MKLSMSLEGVPVITNERYEVGALAHQLARAHGAGTPITLSIESDSGEMLLQSAEHFLCGGLSPHDYTDEHGNAHTCLPPRMPAHAAAELELADVRKELAELREGYTARGVEQQKALAELRLERDTAKLDLAHAKSDVTLWFGVAGGALEVCSAFESMLVGSGYRWRKGLRKKLNGIREAHKGGI